MFLKDQFAEAKSGLVQIQIMRPQNLKKLIDYIYKSQIDFESGNDLMEIYAAAHLYQIEDLRSTCEASFAAHVNVWNAVVMFKFATVYDLVRLREHCVRLISSHIDAVKTTREWKELRDDPDALQFLVELLCKTT